MDSLKYEIDRGSLKIGDIVSFQYEEKVYEQNQDKQLEEWRMLQTKAIEKPDLEYLGVVYCMFPSI